MKKTAASFLLLAASLGGCKHDADSPGPDPGTLAGSWRLTDRQCYCPAGQPLPDEQITFDASGHFQLFRGGALATVGSYAFSQGMPCGGSSTNATQITLTAATPNVYVPHGAYTQQNNTLVIDQCSVADGPKYTYTRQP
ncbi:hypothetical protein GKZ68_10055 [Hymenobacter sp. BRD128]|uniref:hypothetical protein n=1 Tax=Hymenobacter sp. BRD128 TaxID=2675878 RepID=UPI001563B668|nr:hypothetical protein [Hymenobacter sp. BRD128]QKG56941.1 hypothetical protein GKZ68_10055 [Hymenobacter sp. BRD128]